MKRGAAPSSTLRTPTSTPKCAGTLPASSALAFKHGLVLMCLLGKRLVNLLITHKFDPQ